MKKISFSVFFLLFLSLITIAQNYPVHLNSIGFLPNSEKTAVIPHKSESFIVVDAESGNQVFSGKTKGPKYQKDVDQKVWIADFSNMKNPGTYYVEVQGVGKSTDFEIAKDVYNFAAKTAFRAFYLWRCGTAVHGEFKGDVFQFEECHMNDGY